VILLEGRRPRHGVPASAGDTGVSDMAALEARVQAIEEQLAAVEKTASIPPKRPSCQMIIQLVALQTGIDARRIVSAQRDAAVVRARDLALWLAKQTTGQSMSEIAVRFDRDHTSALTAVSRAETRMRTEMDFAVQAERIHKMLDLSFQ
jgi:chromosomal replication initiation ATPase DnaA